MTRPDSHTYMMGIALAVRARASCLGSRVGAVLALDDRIVSTGYNGTPSGMLNCDSGGCERCANRPKYGPGASYDICICVHAEQNALLAAARFGIGVEGGRLYATMRPCFGCTKELLQARISGVYYLHDWKHPDPGVWAEYERIQREFLDGVQRLDVPDADHAGSHSARPMPTDSGHTMPGA